MVCVKFVRANAYLSSCLPSQFMEEIEPVASAVPWMVAVGNHERDYPTVSVSSARRQVSFFTGTDSEGECGVPTAFR